MDGWTCERRRVDYRRGAIGVGIEDRHPLARCGADREGLVGHLEWTIGAGRVGTEEILIHERRQGLREKRAE